MHENMKGRLEDAFMIFHRVYIYSNNTKKHWNDLTDKDKTHPNFKWTVAKLFCLAKKPATCEDIALHIKYCPELNESAEGINDKAVKVDTDKWKHRTDSYIIYQGHPVNVYDVKLLLHLIGVRMIHFIHN